MDVYEMLRNGREPDICHAVQPRFQSNPCVVLKTHAPYGKDVQFHEFEKIELINAARIYICRNPLDTLLSYLNFTRLEYRHYVQDKAYRHWLFAEMLGFDREWSCEQWLELGLDRIPQANIDHALDFVSEKNLLIDYLSPISWQDNILSWMAAGNDMPGHIVRYEDCLEDPLHIAMLSDLFIFSREETLQALVKVNEKARDLARSGDSTNEVFYNKMRAYYYKDYFSSRALGRFFARHETVLKATGYGGLLEETS